MMMATVSRLMKRIVMYVNKPPPNNDTVLSGAATITKQEAQLSQRGRTKPRVVDYFG